MSEPIEEEIFNSSQIDKTYVSSAFPNLLGKTLRIAHKMFDGKTGYEYARVKNELVLRQTSGGRFQIKATFLEDNRNFQSVTIQKFTSNGNPKQYFTFVGPEIAALLKFMSDIKRLHFPNEGKVNIRDSDLEQLLLKPDQAKRLVTDNAELIAALAKTEITSEDIIALGYRKKQLGVFDRLLSDEAYFNTLMEKSGKGPEELWQRFFEKNPWIFGFSLSLINFGPLDGRKLEQTVRGRDLTGPGKRVDALLRSHAFLSTTAFVELKRHDTNLVIETPYRPGVWQPSGELAGAVSQLQGTVAAALEHWRSTETVTNVDGAPTGETLYTTEPRSFVICGRLNQFGNDQGVNERKFRSFELYRRNLIRPEIVTFDELYERAQLIIKASEPA